jgi:hypothetical protein
MRILVLEHYGGKEQQYIGISSISVSHLPYDKGTLVFLDPSTHHCHRLPPNKWERLLIIKEAGD